MIKKLLKWCASFFQKKYRYQFVEEVPDTLQDKMIYIIQNNSYSWQIVMLCPCSCKKTLHMNLVEEHYPFWSFKIDKNKSISIHPSIHRIVGCKSHFFVRQGKIIWCGNFPDAGLSL